MKAPGRKAAAKPSRRTSPGRGVAAPARGNEELERALAEARKEQAATAQILEAISTSGGDLRGVFTAVLKNATHLCEANLAPCTSAKATCSERSRFTTHPRTTRPPRSVIR